MVKNQSKIQIGIVIRHGNMTRKDGYDASHFRKECPNIPLGTLFCFKLYYLDL